MKSHPASIASLFTVVALAVARPSAAAALPLAVPPDDERPATTQREQPPRLGGMFAQSAPAPRARAPVEPPRGSDFVDRVQECVNARLRSGGNPDEVRRCWENAPRRPEAECATLPENQANDPTSQAEYREAQRIEQLHAQQLAQWDAVIAQAQAQATIVHARAYADFLRSLTLPSALNLAIDQAYASEAEQMIAILAEIADALSPVPTSRIVSFFQTAATMVTQGVLSDREAKLLGAHRRTIVDRLQVSREKTKRLKQLLDEKARPICRAPGT